jgi:hypothetical protein
MMSVVPVSLSPGKSPNAVAARWPVPPEYLGSVPNQEQQGGHHKKQSESFHAYLHAEVGGGVHRVTVTSGLAAAAQDQTARRQL